MGLSEQEKANYIQDILLPRFKNSHLVASSSFFDASGTLLGCSEKTIREYGVESAMLDLKIKFNDLPTEFIRKATGVSDSDYIQGIKDAGKKIFWLQQTALKIKSVIYYVSIFPRNNIFKPRLVSITPLFHDNGEAIALQSQTEEIALIGIYEYLHFFEGTRDSRLMRHFGLKEGPIKLSKRQHEIVYLLAQGFTQRQTAELLGISRSNLSKTTAEIICPKFGIFNADTSELISKAIELNYHCHLPASLCRPTVLILNNEIIDLYLAEQKGLKTKYFIG